jgi:uncharacterized protein
MLPDNNRIVSVSELNRELLLALNNAHARETSWLTREVFSHLVRQSCYACGIAPAKGFVLAMNQHAEYDNPNFAWWKDRCQNFVYIDRILVSGDCRRQGIARALYQDLVAWAVSGGYGVVGCEVNEEPPNPTSDLFHAAMGFIQIGSGEPRPGKRVRYLQRQLRML